MSYLLSSQVSISLDERTVQKLDQWFDDQQKLFQWEEILNNAIAGLLTVFVYFLVRWWLVSRKRCQAFSPSLHLISTVDHLPRRLPNPLIISRFLLKSSLSASMPRPLPILPRVPGRAEHKVAVSPASFPTGR
jgi:hypothetical protein